MIESGFIIIAEEKAAALPLHSTNLFSHPSYVHRPAMRLSCSAIAIPGHVRRDTCWGAMRLPCCTGGTVFYDLLLAPNTLASFQSGSFPFRC